MNPFSQIRIADIGSPIHHFIKNGKLATLQLPILIKGICHKENMSFINLLNPS